MTEEIYKEGFKFIEDFGWFPRVTHVLNIIAKGKSYENWLMKQGEGAKEIVSEAGDKGTSIHQRLEEIGKGIEINLEALKPLEKKWVEEFLKWKDENIAEFIETERPVWNNVEEYCGTLDALVKLKDGRVAVLDYKTGRYIYDTTYLQVSAYWKAYESMGNPLPDTALVIRFDKYGGKMEVKEVPELDVQWETFKHALRLWEWQYRNMLLREENK